MRPCVHAAMMSMRPCVLNRCDGCKQEFTSQMLWEGKCEFGALFYCGRCWLSWQHSWKSNREQLHYPDYRNTSEHVKVEACHECGGNSEPCCDIPWSKQKFCGNCWHTPTCTATIYYLSGTAEVFHNRTRSQIVSEYGPESRTPFTGSPRPAMLQYSFIKCENRRMFQFQGIVVLVAKCANACPIATELWWGTHQFENKAYCLRCWQSHWEKLDFLACYAAGRSLLFMQHHQPLECDIWRYSSDPQEIWDLIKRLSPAGAVRQTLWKLWNGGRVHPALGANPLQKGLPPEQYLREGV